MPSIARLIALLTGLGGFALSMAGAAAAGPAILDLSNAIILSAGEGPGPERKAAQMLAEEVAKRTRLRWARENSWPANGAPVILVGSTRSLQPFAKSRGVEIPPRIASEGYHIWNEGAPAPVLWIAGDDSRGVLFGVGCLLRALRFEPQKIWLPADFRADTAPQAKLRGHQLGY